MSAAERVATDPRLSRRRRAVARLRRRRLAGRVALGAALALALWLALWSPLLSVRAVRVIGGRHTSAAQVSEAAGLGSSDNLLLLSTAEVARRAEALPWVRRARVDRMLPGTVRVRVTERRPALVLAERGDRWTLDASGRVLARGRPDRPLPVLTGLDLPAVRPGRRLPASYARAALRAYGALAPRMRARVRVIFAPSAERISFSLDDGVLVRWGAAERPAAKRAALGAVLARLGAEGRSAAYVDVRVPQSPAISNLPVAGAALAPLRAQPGPTSAR